MSNAINDIKSVPQTFSSWNNCMQKGYCKWPAIIGIIVASLIVISIVWCCVRCCCCGFQCCCGCFSCFDRCCPGGRGRKRSKYADLPSPAPYPPPNPYMGYVPPQNPPAYNGPNTATFDVPGNKVHADSLPAMPTWRDAKLEESHRNDMEMGHLEHTGQATGVVPVSGARTSRGGYSELPYQDDSFGQPGNYRGANSTHPYGSDLGAQGMAAQNTAYDPPPPQPQTDRFQYGAAAPAPYVRSSPPQAYTAYSPDVGTSSGEARPPSLLQVGRRPVHGSSREI